MKTAHEAIAAMKAELERRKAIVQNAATQIQNKEMKKHYFGIVEEYVDLRAFLDTLEAEQPSLITHNTFCTKSPGAV